MRPICRLSRGSLCLLVVLSADVVAEEPPVIPVGLDAYRQWDRWPYQRIGARAYMRSTYDRSGGNEGADASHFLYQLADDFNVTLDVEGPGVLYFARYNHWHGSPWHYEVDGTDHLVAGEQHRRSGPPGQRLGLPAREALSPSAGLDLVRHQGRRPARGCRFRSRNRSAWPTRGTHYGTGYYIYHQYVPGAQALAPAPRLGRQTPPDADVLELIDRAGSDLVPRPDSPRVSNSA